MGWNRCALASLFIAGTLMFGAKTLRADDDCQKRIARADHRLHEAAEHHGWDSPQAQRWRHELHEAREYCYQHNHRWWDEDERRWRSDRDWDDRDHDHDRH
jgi:hypothetical protein